MKDVYKLRKRKPLGDKTGLLNVVPQCEELSVKLVRLDAKTKTMNTRNKKNAVNNKVNEMNKDVKSTRQCRNVAAEALEDAFKGKTKLLSVVQEQQKKKRKREDKINNCRKESKTVVPTLQNNLKVVVFQMTAKDTTPENHDTKPNLRRRPPKVYTEQDSTTISNPEGKQETNKGSVPIYKRQLQEEPKKATEDLYEFTDVSPKQKKNTHPHRSSILFDKETYEILQKIEQKEAKYYVKNCVEFETENCEKKHSKTTKRR